MLCKYSLIQATILFSVASTKSYLGCPDISQRQIREKVFCRIPSHPSYVCLFDENQKIFVEFCERSPDFLAPGLKFVVRGGFDGAACPYSRFQPFKFWTNSGNECVLLKSKCEGEGQITKDFGSTTKDVSCRCDYSQGYAFVTLPLTLSLCNPSFEDCSCYKKACSKNHILSADYNCIPTNNIQNHICSADIKAGSYAVESSPQSTNTTEQEVKDIEITDRQGLVTYPAIMILMLLITVIAGLVRVAAELKLRRSKCKKNNNEFMSTNLKGRFLEKSIANSYEIIKDLLQKVLSNNVVIVVGEPKSGKSTIVNYATLLLHNIYGYETIHCKTAEDFDESIKNGHNYKILLIDNVFVCDSSNDDNFIKWMTIWHRLKMNNCLPLNKIKIIITCLPSHLSHCCEDKIQFPIEAIFNITPLLVKNDAN